MADEIIDADNHLCISPKDLDFCLKVMSIIEIILQCKEDSWLRIVKYTRINEHSYQYVIENGGGDELLVVFCPTGVFIKGFDHENGLNQFGKDEWDNDFFIQAYKGIPEEFLTFITKEQKDETTFCAWYPYSEGCWIQNAREDDDGGLKYLCNYFLTDKYKWQEWAEEYYERDDFDLDVIGRIYSGADISSDDIIRLNPEADVSAVFEELDELLQWQKQ